MLKVYADDVYHRACDAFAHALAVAADFLPTPIARDARHRALTFVWQEGFGLDRLYLVPDFDLGISHRVGQMLARLHALPAPGRSAALTVATDLATTLETLVPQPPNAPASWRSASATRRAACRCDTA